MSLVFEYSATTAEPDRYRADVACFIGFVARRAGAPVPAAVRAQLTAAGWVDGIWARPADAIEQLIDLPVVCDSWDLFDRLFAWEARPLAANASTQCTSYLGAAVGSFFARGGRRAVIIRVGDPWPLLESGTQRSAQRRARLHQLIPAFPDADHDTRPLPFEPYNPAGWQGLYHLYGLREVSFVLMPDLADACAVDPPIPDLAPTPPLAAEGFVECSADEPVNIDSSLRNTPAPRLDEHGYAGWQLAVDAVRTFLDQPPREVLLLAALPLPHVDARRVVDGGHIHAQADMLAWLERIGVFGADDPVPYRPSQALVQLAWPWLRTQAATDLPEGLEPPDGVLAGLIAANANLRGCHRSVAGDFSLARLRDVADAEPLPAWGLGDTSPDGQLAQRVCLFAPQADGWALQSDVTLAASAGWRFGGASRLMASILRAARSVGDVLAFEPNGPAVWARLKREMEELLLAYWREGAFAGASASQGFDVRCDRSTMSQADLDAGRMIVLITVAPAVSIERITVVLCLNNTAEASGLQEVV
jgi:hypothetical protein